MIVPYITLAQMLHEAGFPAGRSQQVGCAIVAAESGRDTAAKYENEDEWHSLDRGMWEINDHWHPEVSDECAYDAVCSTREAFRISDGGTDYSPWSTYVNGAYEKHMEAAAVALAGAAQVRTLKASLAAKDAKLAEAQATIARLTSMNADLSSQVVELSDRVAQLEAQIGVALAPLTVAQAKLVEGLEALDA